MTNVKSIEFDDDRTLKYEDRDILTIFLIADWICCTTWIYILAMCWYKIEKRSNITRSTIFVNEQMIFINDHLNQDDR